MGKPILVIVGAGPGVSAAVAKRFGNEGFRIVLLARRAEALNGYTNELNELGIEAHGLTADASDPASLAAAFETINKQHGAPDVLVYNSAVISRFKPTELTETQLLEEFKVNVVGALTSAKQVIPEMIARNQGTILFTGGGLSLYPSVTSASLSIGKAGIRSLAFTLADELKPHGIYVGTVTIGGYVQKGSFFDPDAIAEQYWVLHTNRNEIEYLYLQA